MLKKRRGEKTPRLMAEEPNRENKINNTDDYEADQNLLGFFKLLLEVDKRVNPHLYKKIGKKHLPPNKEIKD